VKKAGLVRKGDLSCLFHFPQKNSIAPYCSHLGFPAFIFLLTSQIIVLNLDFKKENDSRIKDEVS
jgi:hypothetical protein